MKSLRKLVSLLLFSLVTAGLSAQGASTGGPGSAQARSDAPSSQPARHPLKGVIIDIRSDRGALLVKHEEIPGVMRAMTMLLKVDEATLKSARKDQAITGLLVRKPDGWWLEEVKPAS